MVEKVAEVDDEEDRERVPWASEQIWSVLLK